jgi:hypothetical protein
MAPTEIEFLQHPQSSSIVSHCFNFFLLQPEIPFSASAIFISVSATPGNDLFNSLIFADCNLSYLIQQGRGWLDP